MLKIVLQPFQGNEQSGILRLVCKHWKQIVRRSNSVTFEKEVGYFSYHGNMEILDWLGYITLIITSNL